MIPEPAAPRTAPTPAASVSVIVPVWNEAANLPSCLAPVLAAGHAAEVIVVDAGSTDDSTAIARSLGANVLTAPVRQRAAQMNHGAQVARGDVLVFLHADTLLPALWLEALRHALADRPDAVGGVYRRRFRRPSIFLRVTCRLADWRARRFGWLLGDQTLFVRRTAFAVLGGYASLTAFEDLDFSRRLKRLGPTVVLPVTAFSSGRRFAAKGPVRQTLADLRLTARFLRHREAFAAERREPERRPA